MVEVVEPRLIHYQDHHHSNRSFPNLHLLILLAVEVFQPQDNLMWIVQLVSDMMQAELRYCYRRHILLPVLQPYRI
ncbi:hypothetical protein DERP_011149 [Dermatophagoides pteronyssinus]|uniref:Uncharacterized protein n=1 Tax=Dermatophagoides pteronyssinus TaxID=6956 RepID=A0ABQ8J8X8_DERPT|nr:hypothetical protein DERP_011149 [Dermatophagoides pteronyssinus]